MKNCQKQLLTILSKTIYNDPLAELNGSIWQRAKRLDVLQTICNGTEALGEMAGTVRVLWEQNEIDRILEGVPYVICGGAANAVYYPSVLRKSITFIEILSIHPKAVFEKLVQAGYTASDLFHDDAKCIYFSSNDVPIILNVRKGEPLSQWTSDGILNAIKVKTGNYHFQMLSDLVNGLLIQDELNREIKLSGLIDWVLFVYHCLHDQEWTEFQPMIREIGLTDFAKTVTRFGQKYLGLDPSIQWCSGVSDRQLNKLADELFVDDENPEAEKPRRPVLHYLYALIINSFLWKPAYYLMDFLYVLRYRMMDKAEIPESEIRAVEENVTFIYKSFNRQRQAKRLYRSIRALYPKVRIIIADDSLDPLDMEDVIHLPFNSGLSKGLIAALERVDTPYVMRMDDDMLLIPQSKIHEQLRFLERHPEVDLVAVQATPHSTSSAIRFRKMRMEKRLIIPAGVEIEGRTVVYKAVNVFLARTDKVREVGYDANIHILDHYDFFYRAAGKIVCVQDPHAYVMHCHNRFDKNYNRFRNDTEADGKYIERKHRDITNRR